MTNFNKKVFAIGIYDDDMDDPEFKHLKESKEWKMKVINNSALIKNVIRDLQAESVVLEACDERYDAQIADIV